MDAITAINTFFWIAANVAIIYIGVVLIAFIVSYYWWFNPKRTTAGRFIFRFALSLVGVIALVFAGIFIDPRAGFFWFNYPGDVAVWRPALRFIIYGYVAYTVSGLATLVYIRKFHPEKMRTARDRELLQLRGTSPIPIFKGKDD